MLRGKEPTAKLARKQQVSDALLHKWREQFFEGGKAAMNFENGASVRQGSQQKALERQIEELQKVIAEQAVEIRFFKNTLEVVKPSWNAIEAARVEEGMNVEPAVNLLGMSRTSYHRQVRGMVDYTPYPRESVSARHRDVLPEVALKPEAGHRKVRAYAGGLPTDLGQRSAQAA